MHAERERSATELELILRGTEICKELPEVTISIDGFGHTTFKIGKNSIMLIGGGHGGEGSINIKSDPDTQEMLIKRGGYIKTPYIGQHGWVTAWGNQKIDWDEVAELVTDAYNNAAPKRLKRS